MATRILNNVKLGTFVLTGLIFLVILLYMIGKNRHLFGETYELKARFENIQGLVMGNNVRFAGIQAGTVKKIRILNDTTLEVSMIIATNMKTIIRKDAIVSIGTDGLVGNRVVNIVPSGLPAAFAEDGDILVAKKAVSTDQMLQTLYNTNNDVAVIAAELKTTVQRINSSTALWSLLNDNSIPANLRLSAANIKLASAKAGVMVDNLNSLVSDVQNGKGSIGALLKNTALVKNLDTAVLKIRKIAAETAAMVVDLQQITYGIKQDINSGKGTIGALLKDTTMILKLNTSLKNIEEGTNRFNQSMEALQHNFLLRGYFRKQEKRQQKEKH